MRPRARISTAACWAGKRLLPVVKAQQHAVKLAATNLLGDALQGDDFGNDAEGADIPPVALDLGGNHRLGQFRFLATPFQVRERDRLQIVDVVEKDAIQTVHSGSTSRGTAISTKNMGRKRRRCRNRWACSLRKMASGAPVEVMTMSAWSAVS